MRWHTKNIKSVLKELKTSKAGLSESEASGRLKEFGPNELMEKKRATALLIFLRQIRSPLIIILLVAALVSGLFLLLKDAVIIAAIAVLTIGLGFVQEWKAEKAMAALKQMLVTKAKVIRDGEEKEIDRKSIVPGDIIVLEEGAMVPADARLIEVINLKCDESALTGESEPVEKVSGAIADLPVADRKNMVFSGAAASYGRALAVVVGTGMSTEMGRIAELIQVKDVKTPLQKRLESLGKKLGAVCIVICALIFSIGLLRGEQVFTMFLTAVSLAVASVPEGLPAVLTICLALGVERMAKKRAIMRKVASVETLGCITVICSDKTGTLTTGEMTVRKLVCDKLIDITGAGFEPVGDFYYNNTAFNPQKYPGSSLLLKSALLCNNAKLLEPIPLIRERWEILGDPTEAALLVAAKKAGIVKTEKRIAEIPFSSQRAMMSVVTTADNKITSYTKGAPEVILKLCNRIYKNNKIRPFSKREKLALEKTVHEMASDGLRVLAFSYRGLSKAKKYTEAIEKNLIFIGLVGIMDPPRPEIKEALARCGKAGIKTVMITGDHRETAVAVAKELRLKTGKVLTGAELEKLTDKELGDVIEKVNVFARASPENKIRILNALKENGHVVAMTGDGVNDAPALKLADVGVAMGIKGTDVARESSDMILADDNFATIVTAIEEGRGIYDNLRKFIRFILSTNFTEVFIVTTCMIFGLPLPLLPLQILWANLVTESLPGIALGIDPKDPHIMKRKPRSPKEGILSGMTLFIIVGACICFLMALAAFSLELVTTGNLVKAQTMAFTTIVLFEILFIFNCRSEQSALPKFFGNKFLLVAMLISVALQLAVIYTPFLQQMFGTTSLSALDMAKVVLFSMPALAIVPKRFMA